MSASNVVIGPPFGVAPGFTGNLPSRADAVIIGGGIAGASAALELAKSGIKSVLIEKGEVGEEQSGRNWGFVRQQGRDLSELPLAMLSNSIWSTMEKDLGVSVDWVQGGNLALASDPGKIAAYRKWIEQAADMGLHSDLLTMDDVRKMLPGVKRNWAVALFTASDAHANPVKATTAIARAAQAAGATIVTGHKAVGIETSGGEIVGVRTTTGSIATRRVILAAGIWSARLASTAGWRIPQGIVTNSVAASQPFPRFTDLGVWTRELAFRQLADGRVIFSAETATEIDIYLNDPRNTRQFIPVYRHNRGTFKVQVHRLRTIPRRLGMMRYSLPPAQPNLGQLRAVAERMRATFPQLAELRMDSAWAGHIDGTPDGLPIIGAVPDIEGLYAVTGFTGHGFALGPAAGRLIADIILDRPASVDPHAFRPERFREGVRSAPKSLL